MDRIEVDRAKANFQQVAARLDLRLVTARASLGQMCIAVALMALCLPALEGCSRPPPDSTPDGALRTWLEKMEASEEEPTQMREAYELLGPRAKRNLAERAERAGRAEGRHVEPWDVLAEGRFGLKFRPQRMTSTVHGDEATVEVVGADPVIEHATVSCDREPLAKSNVPAWRIEPEFPPLPPLGPRSRADQPRDRGPI